MTTIILHIKLRVKVPEETPQKMIDDYVKGYTESPDKGLKRAREAVPDVEAVIEKIIKPALRSTQNWLNPKYTPKHGHKPPPGRAELERRARKYLKKMKHAFRDGGKEYLAIIKRMAEIYGKSMRPTLAITGFKDEIRGVSPVAALCLIGNESVLPLILPEEMIKGPLINVILEGREGRFSSRLNSQLISDGNQIINQDYQPDDIIEANAKINEVVNSYARDGFVPFTPNGASHVDFIREKGQLFLDIQVSVP